MMLCRLKQWHVNAKFFITLPRFWIGWSTVGNITWATSGLNFSSSTNPRSFCYATCLQAMEKPHTLDGVCKIPSQSYVWASILCVVWNGGPPSANWAGALHFRLLHPRRLHILFLLPKMVRFVVQFFTFPRLLPHPHKRRIVVFCRVQYRRWCHSRCL